MNWIAPGIETDIAYGTCMFLFGLLVLSVKHRRMATTPANAVYASPMGGTLWQAPKNKSVLGSRRTTVPVQHIGVLTSTGLLDTPRIEKNAQAPNSSTNILAAPLEFQAPQNSNEVKMNSPSFPFESLDPIALAELSAYSTPTAAPTTPNKSDSPLTAYGIVELEEPTTRDIMVASHPHALDGGGSDAPILQESNAAEQDGTEDLIMFPLPQSYDPIHEKTASEDLLSFYGLIQQPFDVTPDPAFLYLSPSHRDALASLKQGIEHFRGFMLLVAEPGMGKTTLLHKLMEEQAESARVVFLFQTQCSSRELLCFILNELEVDHTGMDVVAMHRALNQALLEEMLRGRRFVLVVDEAQNLQEPVLETIRLLSDFETTHSKLIQIVLAGQPQLAETLMRDSLVQLRQRIAVLSSLKSLSMAETAEYIEHRLRASGWSGETIFTSEALAQIAELSGGVPRSINNSCFNALLEAFHRGLKVVDADIVKEVAGKLNLESLLRRPQIVAAHQQSTAQLSGDVAAAPNTEASPKMNAQPFIGPLPKPDVPMPKQDVFLTGNLTEKVRSQGWSKHHEYRILVSLERDPFSGLPVADRYYCCSIYVDEAQAAKLQPGKPVRIKIEQD
jgi:type II secretory pathway predicted ATPase ExeA